MAKKLLPEVNIGLIGHVDHGKTTLTHALTGKWTMIHSEELKRGITIKLGYADCDIKKCEKCDKFVVGKKCKCGGKPKTVRKVSFVDAPGHETLMAVMISGAAIMDGAILVVAANEKCPQPQTQEHLMALKIMGIKNIIIVQNKIDLITKKKALENYKAIKEFAEKTLGFKVPIIPVSALKKVNLGALLKAIQEKIPTPKRDLSKNPLLLIARSFDINKPGTKINKIIGGVLGGAISQGQFKVGDDIEIKPGREIEKKGGQKKWISVKTKIKSIACGGEIIKEKGPGGTIAISTELDSGITKSDAFVGNVLGKPDNLPPVFHDLKLKTHLFNYVIGSKEKIKMEPIKQYEPLMLSVGTATTIGLPQSAGDIMELKLKRPVCASKGDKVAIGRQIKNRWRLIGYGVVL
ncbi:translation initiation factor IF-2 subunit gamma [Candidatus Woesearchaeota archaeon]|nr:translation initiation factor IF-2 subunit gamma [Candidatus Woesearchaeota archaeon]